MIRKEDITTIGHFAKPHGIKGKINLILSKDVSFDDWDEPYLICEMEGILVPFYLEEYQYKSDTTLLVKLENIDSDEAARELMKHEAYCPPDIVLENDDDTLTWEHFTGYEVFDNTHALLGKITGVDESTINVLLIVNNNDKEWLIPAAEELILSVEHDNKKLIIKIPEGLSDLFL
ncbi:MAG: ribosome maturation factor RimM [Tannerellaceae bacterium]|jgi:16S rRNA processing protein RimM|nr:ribosome maturation factor RimM [Tannerellaceae bacterium]